ncbi:MAG TPA: hypothetical protein VKW04_03545 [Planctomycetota bacterium]|nr:hypothetical protein [Planctomycetota bacterium]
MGAGMMSVLVAGFLLLQAESPGRLIDQLGSDDEARRVDAATRLEALGGEAIPELKSAISFCKPRTAALAQRILDAIEVRLSPEHFERLTSTLMTPKTCRFTVGIAITFNREPDRSHLAWAQVSCSGADKVRVDSSVRICHEQDTESWICNGTTAWRKFGDGEWTEVPAVPDVRRKTVAAVLGLSGPDPIPWMGFDFSKNGAASLQPRRPAPQRREGRHSHLFLELEENPGTPEAYAMDGVLQFDPDTLLPVSCDWDTRREKKKVPERGRIRVTYKNFRLGGDLDETLFRP